MGRVESDGILHSGVIRGDPRIGSAVALSIRKDRTRLSTESSEVLNSLAGVVTEVLYFGSERELLVQTRMGGHLSCRITATERSRVAGEPVVVVFDPRDAYIFS